MAKRQRSVDPPLAPLLPFWEDSSSCVLGIIDLRRRPSSSSNSRTLSTLPTASSHWERCSSCFVRSVRLPACRFPRRRRSAGGAPARARRRCRRPVSQQSSSMGCSAWQWRVLRRTARRSPRRRTTARRSALQSSVNASVQNLCQQLVVSLGALDQTAVAAALARVRAALARSGSPAAAEALLVRGGAAAPAGETAAQALAPARQHLKELQPAAPAPAACSAVSEEWLASVRRRRHPRRRLLRHGQADREARDGRKACAQAGVAQADRRRRGQRRVAPPPRGAPRALWPSTRSSCRPPLPSSSTSARAAKSSRPSLKVGPFRRARRRRWCGRRRSHSSTSTAAASSTATSSPRIYCSRRARPTRS